MGYVEGLNDARTLLADFFSILIIPLYSLWQRDTYRAWHSSLRVHAGLERGRRGFGGLR